MTEEEAKFNLDICGYSGKWKQAKELNRFMIKNDRYWKEVRLTFLELGGEYINKNYDISVQEAVESLKATARYLDLELEKVDRTKEPILYQFLENFRKGLLTF